MVCKAQFYHLTSTRMCVILYTFIYNAYILLCTAGPFVSRTLHLRLIFGFWPASLAVCNTMNLPFFTFIDRPSTIVRGMVFYIKKKTQNEERIHFESIEFTIV